MQEQEVMPHKSELEVVQKQNSKTEKKTIASKTHQGTLGILRLSYRQWDKNMDRQKMKKKLLDLQTWIGLVHYEWECQSLTEDEKLQRLGKNQEQVGAREDRDQEMEISHLNTMDLPCNQDQYHLSIKLNTNMAASHILSPQNNKTTLQDIPEGAKIRTLNTEADELADEVSEFQVPEKSAHSGGKKKEEIVEVVGGDFINKVDLNNNF